MDAQNPTFRLALTWKLSSEGQREATRRLLPANARQETTIEAPIGWLDELPIAFSPGGSASLDLTAIPDPQGGAFFLLDQPLDAIDAVDAWKKRRDELAAKAVAKLAETKRRYLDDESSYTPAELVDDPEVKAESLRRQVQRWLDQVPKPTYGVPGAPPREAADQPDIAAEYQRRLDAYEEARRAAAEKTERDKAERERRRVEARARTLAFLQEHGTESQAERFEAAVLPSDELEKLIEQHYLGGIMHRFPAFERMTIDEVCASCADHGREMEDYADGASAEDLFSFQASAADELTGPQWDRLKKIRAQLPEGATAEPRDRWGTCNDDDHDDPGHGYLCRQDVLVKLSTPLGVDLRVSLDLPRE